MSLPIVTVSAPGKVILFGEHAVVYGATAVACSINMRTFVTISTLLKTELVRERSIEILFKDQDQKISIDLETLQLDPSNSISLPINDITIEAIVAIIKAFNIPPSLKLSIEIKSKIPIGAGLGSSAAFCSALAGALYFVLNQRLDPEEINALALLGEKRFHLNPSGIDSFTSINGAITVFKSGKASSLKELIDIPLIIVDTGICKNTRHQVALVQGLYNANPEAFKEKMSKISEISEHAIQMLSKGNSTLDLSKLFKDNQMLLSEIGVSNEAIDNFCTLMLDTFNTSFKITGAGGGGCLVAIAEQDKAIPKEQLDRIAKEHFPQAKIYYTSALSTGLRIEK